MQWPESRRPSSLQGAACWGLGRGRQRRGARAEHGGGGGGMRRCSPCSAPWPCPLQSKYKPLKFSCPQRTMLLADLYQCVQAAAALGRCPLAPKLLGWVLGRHRRLLPAHQQSSFLPSCCIAPAPRARCTRSRRRRSCQAQLPPCPPSQQPGPWSVVGWSHLRRSNMQVHPGLQLPALLAGRVGGRHPAGRCHGVGGHRPRRKGATVRGFAWPRVRPGIAHLGRCRSNIGC